MDARDAEGLARFYDAVADTYAAVARDIGAYHGHVAAFLAREALAGRRVLDVACGPGNLTAALSPEVEVVGIDLSARMIELAREARPRGRWVQGSFHDPVPASLGQFDVVLLMSAFEFCLDLPRVVRHLADATRPGGTLLLGITERRDALDAATHAAPAPGVPGDAIEIHLFTLEEMVAAFRHAGLAPRRYESIHGWTDDGGSRIPYALWELGRPESPRPPTR